MSQQPQNYKTHAKMVPGFHYVGSLLMLALLISAISGVVRSPSVATAMTLILVFTLVLIGFYARSFALGVQDRVIRLEERLRMERVLPEDLQERIPEFSTDQLIGLRFAPNEELEDLARRVLSGEITDRKQIKMAVKNWRADHERV
jgi:hypothetical protein